MGDIDAVYQESSLLSEQMNIVRQDIEKVRYKTMLDFSVELSGRILLL